ncbi:hypothetical protein QTP86_020279, partial [Hemibagrus guttatus]
MVGPLVPSGGCSGTLPGLAHCFLISDLTKKGQPDWVQWNSNTEQALLKLNEALINYPTLRNPDFGLPFTLHMDASETGLGAIMSQSFEEEEHPVSSL